MRFFFFKNVKSLSRIILFIPANGSTVALTVKYDTTLIRMPVIGFLNN